MSYLTLGQSTGAIIEYMSALTSKRVLLVGDTNKHVSALVTALEAHGMTVDTATCEAASANELDTKGVDLILLNHTQGKNTCAAVLDVLQQADFSKVVPVFAFVEDSNQRIEEVLNHGAADYITPDEDPQSVIQKIKTIFGQGDNFIGPSIIDITPRHAKSTTPGTRVFVVEDDPLLRNLLSIRMEQSSFCYAFSSDGQGTLPVMKQFKPDVIILDLMLPGKSGFDVLEEVKGDEALAAVPVVVFSNRDSQEDRQKAKQLGAAGFYVKAMTDLSELIETIEKLVE